MLNNNILTNYGIGSFIRGLWGERTSKEVKLELKVTKSSRHQHVMEMTGLVVGPGRTGIVMLGGRCVMADMATGKMPFRDDKSSYELMSSLRQRKAVHAKAGQGLLSRFLRGFDRFDIKALDNA